MTELEPYWGMSRALYLQEMCNLYGDFKVARAWMNAEGEILWTKHRSIMECWQTDEGIAWLNTVNNRGGYECEIRIDIDPPTGEDPDVTRKRFDSMCDRLESFNIKHYQGWFSGSRGYHIHFIALEFATDPSIRQKVRTAIIHMASADQCKVVDSSMLTLEWAPNNKTGRPKVPIRGDFTCPIH